MQRPSPSLRCVRRRGGVPPPAPGSGAHGSAGPFFLTPVARRLPARGSSSRRQPPAAAREQIRHAVIHPAQEQIHAGVDPTNRCGATPRLASSFFALATLSSLHCWLGPIAPPPWPGSHTTLPLMPHGVRLRSRRKSSPPILQIAFKYTVLVHCGDTPDVSNSGGSRSKYSLQRRIRVRTIQYNTTANIWDLYDFVDPDVVLTILVHQVILASSSNVLEARLWLQDWLVAAIAQYNQAYKNVKYGGGTGIYGIDVDFSHCSQLQPLSRFVFAILLSPLLQVNSEGIHPDYQTYLQCLFSALEPASLRQAIWPTLISYSSPDVEAQVHQSLSRTAFTSESPIFLLDAYCELLVYYSPTASSAIPFPPPRDCLLRSTVDRLKQERNITPKLIFIHGAHDDTTTFEKYLVEDQTLDGSLLASSTGFSSFLDEVRREVAEHDI